MLDVSLPLVFLGIHGIFAESGSMCDVGEEGDGERMSESRALNYKCGRKTFDLYPQKPDQLNPSNNIFS